MHQLLKFHGPADFESRRALSYSRGDCSCNDMCRRSDVAAGKGTRLTGREGPVEVVGLMMWRFPRRKHPGPGERPENITSQERARQWQKES